MTLTDEEKKVIAGDELEYRLCICDGVGHYDKEWLDRRRKASQKPSGLIFVLMLLFGMSCAMISMAVLVMPQFPLASFITITMMCCTALMAAKAVHKYG